MDQWFASKPQGENDCLVSLTGSHRDSDLSLGFGKAEMVDDLCQSSTRKEKIGVRPHGVFSVWKIWKEGQPLTSWDENKKQKRR